MEDTVTLPIVLERNRRALQAAYLYGSMVAALVLNLVASELTTRILGPAGYGDVKFVQSLWMFGSIVSTFGYLQSASRLALAEADETRTREIVGLVLIASLAAGVVIAVASAALAFPIEALSNLKVARLLLLLAPLVLVMPLRDGLALVLQNANQIGLLGFLNLVPIFLYSALVWLVPPPPAAPQLWVLLLQLGTMLAACMVVAVLLRPRWPRFGRWLERLGKENRSFGWPIYIGSLAGVASSYVNRIALAFWADNVSVGFLSLALSLVEPLKLIPNAVATSSYRGFAQQSRIGAKTWIVTIGVSLLTMAGALWGYGGPVRFLYGSSFGAVSSMSRVAAFGAVAHGFGDFFNRFLGAHGRGRDLRNGAFIVGGINALGFLVAVPLWGTWGALGVTCAAGFGYLAFMAVCYRRYVGSPLNLALVAPADEPLHGTAIVEAAQSRFDGE